MDLCANVIRRSEDIATIAQEIIDACSAGSTISGTRLLSRDTKDTSIRVSKKN